MPYTVPPELETMRATAFALQGEIGRRLAVVTEQSILPMPQANPGMLAMFSERDRLPLRNMLPWAGEFAGKYLTHAVQVLALTDDRRLRDQLQGFVGELLAGQDADGYIGPWPRPFRLGLAGPPPNTSQPWDLWGHYHIMLGLLKWHELTGNAAAFAATRRIADLLCKTFMGTGRRVHEVGELEMNMAPYHALLLLFARTGDRRYAELAGEIEQDLERPPAGDYVRTALKGMEYHETSKPRWESLHAIQGIAEKYFLTGDLKYRQAFEHLWWSMLKGDRHNNGGFTTGERATGNPYQALGAIETCCTVAWTAMSVDMLRLTGNSVVADELELTLFNSGLGLMSPSGRWVTYDTPMDGRRENSTRSIAFQARAGTSELNCCSVNGPRVLSSVVDWALQRRADTIVLNYYGPGLIEFDLPQGGRCTLTQETEYPRRPDVRIHVGLAEPRTFPLALRIPGWSAHTTVSIAGQPVERIAPGEYLVIERLWRSGDAIDIGFDFSPHFWVRDEPGYFYTDWEAEWRVFGPTATPERADRLAVLSQATTLPDQLVVGGQSLTAVTATSQGGILDVRNWPRQITFDTVYAFTVVDSPEPAMMPIRFSAAYWSIITVNGQKIFDGESCNFDGDVSVRLCRVNLPLRKGKNLVGWSVSQHPHHPTWCLTAGRAAPRPAQTADRETDYRLASIYRGPILLTFDHRFNAMDVESIPGLEACRLELELVADRTPPVPWLLVTCCGAGGEPVRLCDFASAGATGNPYRTWLNVRGVEPAEFSRTNPWRSTRPSQPAPSMRKT